MDSIYLDNNATTPLLPAVLDAMAPFFTAIPGNPASGHAFGRRARQALEQAREVTAHCSTPPPDEVIFTSGATEANNLGVFGLAGTAPAHLLASPLEHPCVTEPLRRLAASGFALDWLPVDPEGRVHADALAALLRPDTRLVSVMLANHETGGRCSLLPRLRRPSPGTPPSFATPPRPWASCLYASTSWASRR